MTDLQPRCLIDGEKLVTGDVLIFNPPIMPWAPRWKRVLRWLRLWPAGKPLSRFVITSCSPGALSYEEQPKEDPDAA